jgi:hypothetical protein
MYLVTIYIYIYIFCVEKKRKKRLHECWGVLKLGSKSSFEWGVTNGGNHQGFGLFIECHHESCRCRGQKCSQPQQQKDPIFLASFLYCGCRVVETKLWFSSILLSHLELRERESSEFVLIEQGERG